MDNVNCSRITYDFSNDSSVLEQYFAVRKQVYMSDFELNDYADHEDIYDDLSYSSFIIAKDGDKVIGGTRIVIRTPENDFLLPLETDVFQIANVMKDNDPIISQKSYSEVNRTVLLPEYRGGTIYSELCKRCSRYNWKLGISYVFAVNPLIQARNTRNQLAPAKIKYRTLLDVKVPERDFYHGKKMFLSYVDINETIPVWYKNENTSPTHSTEKVLATA